MAKKAKKVSKAQQFQDLVTATFTDLRNRLDGLRAEVDRAWALNNTREGVAIKNRVEVEKYAADTTKSIYALRDNTQTAFSQVARDIARLQNAIDDARKQLQHHMSQVPPTSQSVLNRLYLLEADVTALKAKKIRKKK